MRLALPGCGLFIRLHYADRAMAIDAAAVSSDYFDVVCVATRRVFGKARRFSALAV